MKIETMLQAAVAAFALMGLSACGPGKEPAAGGKPVQAVTAAADKPWTSGITATPPDGWYVMPIETTEAMMDRGGAIVFGDDEMLRAAEASKQTSHQIFTYFKHAPGSPVESNPSVLAMTENVAPLPGIKTGKDYFFNMRKVLEKANAPMTISDTYASRRIGGHDFDRMDVTVSVMDRTMTQYYYATRHGDDVFAFIQSFQNEEERAETDKVLDSVKIDW